ELHGRNDRMGEPRDVRPDPDLPQRINATGHQDLPPKGAIKIVFPLDQQHVDPSLHEQESDCRARRTGTYDQDSSHNHFDTICRVERTIIRALRTNWRTRTSCAHYVSAAVSASSWTID